MGLGLPRDQLFDILAVNLSIVVYFHRPEFQENKRCPITPYSLLAKEHRTFRRKAYGRGNQAEQGGAKDQSYNTAYDIDYSLDDRKPFSHIFPLRHVRIQGRMTWTLLHVMIPLLGKNIVRDGDVVEFLEAQRAVENPLYPRQHGPDCALSWIVPNFSEQNAYNSIVLVPAADICPPRRRRNGRQNLADLFAMFVVCRNVFDIQQHEEERPFGSFGSFSLQGDYRVKGVFFQRSAIRAQDHVEAAVRGGG